MGESRRSGAASDHRLHRRIRLVLTIGLALVLASAAGPGAHAADTGPGDVAASSSAAARVPDGPAELLTTGGPDSYGYTFSDNISDPTIGNNFIDISPAGSGSGEAIPTFLLANNGYGVADLGFGFEFYGEVYQQISIYEDGYILFEDTGFGGPPGVDLNECPLVFGAGNPNNGVYGFWDDLDIQGGIGGGARVYTATLGRYPNRVYVIQYDNMPFDNLAPLPGDPFDPFGRITFQIQLIERTGQVRLEYRLFDPPDPFNTGRPLGSSATVGIESPDHYFTGLQYGCNGTAADGRSPLIQDFLAILFTPPPVDLSIDKTDDPDPVHAGEQLYYEITVHNESPVHVNATNTTVTDTLPAGIDYIADTDDCEVIGTGPLGGTRLRCNLGIVPDGEDRGFQIKTHVPFDFVAAEPDGVRAITNTAEVMALQPDSDLDNNVIVEGTIVEDLADLRVTKVSKPDDQVHAGEVFTYTIYVDNLGPSAARGVFLDDDIVSNDAFTVLEVIEDPLRNDTCINRDIAPPQGGHLIECTLNEPLEPMAYGDPDGRWRIQIRAIANETQDIDNIVRVDTGPNSNAVDFNDQPINPTGTPAGWINGTPDPDKSNNVAQDNISIIDTSDIRVTKDATGEVQVADGTQEGRVFDITNPGNFPAALEYTTDPDEVTAGRRISYTLTVTNFGPSTAENVLVTDRLPPGVTIVPGSLAASQGSCETGTPGEPLDRMKCGLGTLAAPPTDPATGRVVGAGGSATVTFHVLVGPSIPAGTVLENDLFAISQNVDPDNSNNHAFTQTTVNTWADMEITKMSVGENTTGWDATLRRFIFTDLRGQVTAGHELRYELTVQNTGASAAQNVQILDLLPGQTDTGLTHDPVTFLWSTEESCRPLDEQQELGVFGPGAVQGKFGQILWCDLGTIPAGARRTFDVYVLVDSAVPDGFTLTNGAYVWWGAASPPATPGAFLPFPLPQIPPELPTTNDPFLDDNFATTDTDVDAVADVFIEKVDVPAEERLDRQFEPDLAIAGMEHRYLITFGNDGPSVALDVGVEDLLDDKQLNIPGETFLRCEPVDPDDEVICSEDGGVVTVDEFLDGNEAVIPAPDTGALNPGDEYSFWLITMVDPGYKLDGDDTDGDPHLIADNTALISTTTMDYRQGNNRDTELTEIDAEADLEIDIVDDQGGFLDCDPVEPGGTTHYHATVWNRGPSDAAAVIAQIQLPEEVGLVLEPDEVEVEVSDGRVLQVRDDGRITVVLGEQPNNEGELEVGRMNVGTFETVDVWVQVRLDAECGSVLTTTADVRTLPGYTAVLSGDDEVPPVATAASGMAHLFLDEVPRELFYFIEVENIAGITAAHLHRGAPGVNGPVAHELYDAEKDEFDFDPANPLGDSVLRLSAADIEQLEAELLYVNVHTEGFPAGEIRGQITHEPWPLVPEPWPGIDGGARVPTPDPVLANNEDDEDTTIECPAVVIDKTISFDGKCPGQDVDTVDRPGRPVTFCFEITNTGTTYLDDITITDTLKTRTGERIVYEETITCETDPDLPLAPGDTITRSVTLPFLCREEECECGPADDTAEVSANPVNSGCTDLTCLDIVRDVDTQRINIPCSGVDTRLALPALATLGLPAAPVPPSPFALGDEVNQATPATNCESWIQVQNVGAEPTKAMIILWGAAGSCPPQAAGPLKIECSGLLRPGAAWSFAPALLPPGAESGIVYSLSNDLVLNERGNELPFADLVCDSLFRLVVGDHVEWVQFDHAYRNQRSYRGPLSHAGEQLVLDFGAHQGEPLAVTVNRTCPDPADPNASGSATYGGISTDLQGAPDPFSGGHMYYAPMVFADKGGLNSWLHIQNVGIECSSLELWFKAQDNCMRPILGDVLSVSPGESVHFDPNTVVGPDWMGSGWIRSSQPLAFVIDTMGPNHFSSYNGVPADVWSPEPAETFSLGTEVNYAPLVYNQHQGWDTALIVQNLSSTTAAKAKVYFLDRSGDIIHTLVDWICPRGSQTFFLPVINGLPGNWVGSARVESQNWWTPGDPQVDAPRLQSVVLLEKWADPARSARREAMAYNAATECDAYNWQIGAFRGGTQSGSAVLAVPLVAKDNRGITTELAITNVVPKPGFTDFAIFIYDQNGRLDFVCEKLNEKQVEYIDFARWGWIHPHFLGSAVVSAVFWEHDVFDPEGQFTRNVVGLSGVIVERIGGTLGGPDVPGDESKAVGMFPVFESFYTEPLPSCPGVP